MKARVGAGRCGTYDPIAIEDGVNAAIEAAGGLPELMGPGKKVLVKPNLLLPAPPERGITTHPTVLKAVIKAIQSRGAEVVVGEGPGLLTMEQVRRAFVVSGTAGVCDGLGVAWAPFAERGFREVEVPCASRAERLFIANDLLDADAVVSVAKAKSHLQAMFTGCVKNMFGSIAPKERKRLHTLAKYVLFSESLVDILAATRPAFSVMDAVIGMGGRGPSEGKLFQIGFIVAGADAVAVDRVTASLMSYHKVNIHHLEHAAMRGLGVSDLSAIDVVGADPVADRVKVDPPPTWYRNMPAAAYRFAYRFISILPEIDPELCRECMQCAEACPAECITFEDGPRIDRETCIECFCCHELCPHGAVKEKVGIIRRIGERLKGGY